MESGVATQFELPYVILSYIISVVGAFLALSACSLMRTRQGKLSLTNTLAAGVALGGIGVWSMHFVGMLALSMDVGSAYSLPETAISLVAAIAAATVALAYVSAAPDRASRVLGAGFLLGLGVTFMHYLGMFGIRIEGYLRWDYGVVVLSALIGVGAASAALWLAFRTYTLGMRIFASLVMGVAVCAMHYTGMNAAEFVCTTAVREAIPQGPLYVSVMNLPSLVATVTFGLAMVIAFDQAFQRIISRRTAARRA